MTLTYYYGAGGNPGQSYTSTMQGYQNQMLANQNIQGGINQGYKAAIAGLDTQGQAQRFLQQQDFAKQNAATNQQMMNSGLYNSTLTGSAQNQNSFLEAQAGSALEQQVSAQKYGAQKDWLGYQVQAGSEWNNIYGAMNQYQAGYQQQQSQLAAQQAMAAQQQSYNLQNQGLQSYAQRSMQGNMVGGSGGSSSSQPFTSMEKGSPNWLQPSGATGGYYVGGGGWGAGSSGGYGGYDTSGIGAGGGGSGNTYGYS